MYLWLSVVITLLAYPFWSTHGWWEAPLQIMPNVLSFSLGGFAICLAFGDEKFKALIAGNTPNQRGAYSPYVKFSATFVHFILLQVLSLVLAVLSKAWYSAIPYEFILCFAAQIEAAKPFFWGFSFFIFIYALMTAVAATMAIFVMARSFDTYHTIQKAQSPGDSFPPKKKDEDN